MAPKKRVAHKPADELRNQVSGQGKNDLRGNFRAPFAIFSEEEGRKFREFKDRVLLPPRYFDFDVLENLSLRTKLERLAGNIGWGRLIRSNYLAYPVLTLEFFTTVRYNKNMDLFWFRLDSRPFKLDYLLMRSLFDLSNTKVLDDHSDFDIDAYWKSLTGETSFDSRNAPNILIKSTEHLLLHKFMCMQVFNKSECNKCSSRELFFLWCMDRKIKINTPYHIFRSIVGSATKRSSYFALGYLVTAVALHYNINLDGWRIERPDCFDIPYLRRSEIVEAHSTTLRLYETRTSVKSRKGKATAGSQPSSSHAQEKGPVPTEAEAAPTEEEQFPTAGVIQMQQILDQMASNHQQMTQHIDQLHTEMKTVKKGQNYLKKKVLKYFQMKNIQVPSPTPSPPQSP